MYFNIKCIGKLPGPTNEFERSLVFETGEFERPKFDCISVCSISFYRLVKSVFKLFYHQSQQRIKDLIHNSFKIRLQIRYNDYFAKRSAINLFANKY